MVNKIIRNFVAKMVAGRSDDGIMITLRDPQKVEFQTAMMQDLLMRRGIDPNAIQSEAQLKMIINQIKAMEKAEDAAQSGIRNTESAKVFNIEGQQLDPNKPIIGGTQTDKKLSKELSDRLSGKNTELIKQRISNKKIDDDLPPPGSRGGDDDIAAPVQSAEESLRDMTEAEIKANIEAQNKKGIENILKRKNREDVYGLEDYDTTNMSEIKKEIIRTETKLGNLNPDSPDFREKAKALSDRIIALKNKMREDKAGGGRIGLKSGSILESLGFTPEHTAAVADMDKDFSGSQFDYAAASTKDMVDKASNPVTAAISAAGNVVARPVYDFVDAAKEYSKKGYQGEFSFTPQGIVDFGKNLASFGKEFIDQKPLTMMTGAAKGGLEGVIDRFTTQETPIDPTSKNLFTQYYEDDPYAGIKDQTAFLPIDPITAIGGLVKVAKGAKAKTLAKEFFFNKAKEKAVKEISKEIQKKINKTKYPTTPIITSGGGSDSGGGANAGGAKLSSGMTTGQHRAFRMADGGRIGFVKGTGLRFLQRVFGKEKFAEMKTRDPEMYVGLLEVVDMYRKRDKEGLKMYLQKFLPHMDDAQIEDFIRGSDGTEGLIGELIRLGSGRDYAGKIEMMKKADEMRKLDNLEVTDDMKRKPNADGGIMRLGLKEGSGMSRRTFLKFLAGAASIPIIGKIFKPLKIGKTVTKVPIIKTDNVPGKPEWFDQLVNKVILEGDDVTKRFATKDREIVHMKKLDEDTNVMVYQDIDEGAVRVEYESPESMYGDPVSLRYKKPNPDEGDPRPTADFDVAESGPVGRADGPDDYSIEIDEVGGTSISDLTSDVSKLKEYATGQKPTLKEFVQSKKRKDKARRITEGGEAEMDAVIERQGEFIENDLVDLDPPDYASGGIARMLGE